MLLKFLKLAPFSSRARPKPAAQCQQKPEESQETSSALKIVHAGGKVECYYMAIPAVNIMKKYPALILARPEVFRRPWDSLVRSDEILTPGEKFYVVPRRTVRKLRRRIKKPNIGEVSVNSFVSHDSSIDVSKNGLTSKCFLQRNEVSESSEMSGSFISSRKKNGTKKHVRFAGIDEGIVKTSNRKSTDFKSQGGKRKTKYGALWQPSLTAINERHGHGE